MQKTQSPLLRLWQHTNVVMRYSMLRLMVR